MTGNFLHTEKSNPPQDGEDEKPAACDRCGEEMWLVRVTKTISDRGIDGRYRFECKNCGSVTRVTTHDAV
jgi:uncharacterized Zn finger protein